jgi:hypothetical protein
MELFMNAIGRKCHIVNLDFANDSLSYEPSIDVRELISLEVEKYCFASTNVHIFHDFRK